MDAKEWRKKEIKLKQKITKFRNEATAAKALHEKIAILSFVKIAVDDLHRHRLEYHLLVTK